MSLFKCKMCGGTLGVQEGDTIAECEYCGTKQTLPRLHDDKRANMYDRANHFRRNNEFDKAMGIYEHILNEDSTDSEAYWSLVLCRYGIEYVEDTASHKRIPTVNRSQFTSIFDDDNYKSAIHYADNHQRAIYEEEANTINEIQKGILAISQKEEPFDVFVCYKESDNNGRRTLDSVLAQELYYQLIQEGFKVFFARITLEDKLGSAYEPYIFAALNSAKVMVVIGTRPEYLNAVWVKNEWSRFLALIKNGSKKTLIPAYRDMNPYDLPDEFSHLQAQDMSKLGFMQDLIRGIKKIVGADAPAEIVTKNVMAATTLHNVSPLLKRAFMFLEDGDFDRADEFCEQVLNQDPENAEAYLGKLMAELKVKSQDRLKDYSDPIDRFNNYRKAYRFGDEELKKNLENYNKQIRTRNENARLLDIYIRTKIMMNTADAEEDFREAAELFDSIKEYSDAAELAKQCWEKSESIRIEYLYNKAVSSMQSAKWENEFKAAADLFNSCIEYGDSEERCKECLQKADEAHEKAEEQRKYGIYLSAIHAAESKKTMNPYYTGGLEKAVELLETIPDWRDAGEKISEYKNQIEELKAQEESAEVEAEALSIKTGKRIRGIIIAISVSIIILALTLVVLLLLKENILQNSYDKATDLIEESKKPPVTNDTPTDKPGDDKPSVPSGSISTFQEITLETSLTDEKGGMTIEVVADALLRQFIMEASALDSTSYKVTSIQEVRPLIFDHNSVNPGIFTVNLNSSTWFISAYAKVVAEGKLSTDSKGESSLGGRYIVKKGKTYTLYAQAAYEALPPEEIYPFVWGEYDASTPISTAEMTLSNGVKLAMTYEEVEAKMGAFDSVDTSVARVRTATKKGYTFTFSLVDDKSTYATDWGLPHDGKYYLTQVVADETCTDEFPRGIKIGDTIETVFTKIPSANTKLNMWAEQRLYGASNYAEGNTYCWLEYRPRLFSYRIVAQDTDRDYIAIAFDKTNVVKSFEWIYRQ